MVSAWIASSPRPSLPAQLWIGRRSAPSGRGHVHDLGLWRLITLLIVALAAADALVDLPQLRQATWILAVLVAAAAVLLAAAAAESIPAALLHDSAPLDAQTFAEHTKRWHLQAIASAAV